MNGQVGACAPRQPQWQHWGALWHARGDPPSARVRRDTGTVVAAGGCALVCEQVMCAARVEAQWCDGCIVVRMNVRDGYG